MNLEISILERGRDMPSGWIVKMLREPNEDYGIEIDSDDESLSERHDLRSRVHIGRGRQVVVEKSRDGVVEDARRVSVPTVGVGDRCASERNGCDNFHWLKGNPRAFRGDARCF